MAMNKYMHPRNPYKKAPDFLQLTLEYPSLRKFVKPDLSGKIKMNFKTEGAVRELTTCLLHKDFGLKIELPPDRLVPTLPLRMNYLLWIEDLLNEPGKQFKGIDIGTGASCIYPLLAVKHFNWVMTGTEINEESLKYAVKNVESNGLNDAIKVKAVTQDVMLDGALDQTDAFDFSMCNPPFFSDESEVAGKARTDRRAPPRNHPSGRSFELVAPGGETAFISRIIEDSVKLKTRIKVYTVMIGHKANLNKVRDILKKVNPVKIRTTEFCQGRTTRWGLAWTFSQETHLISTAIQPKKDSLKPPFRWIYPSQSDIQTLKTTLTQMFESLNIDFEEVNSEDDSCGLCLKAFENTWAHSRRKRREEQRKLIESQVVSPCDSVVTANDSVPSSHPSSPVESIGYVSSDEASGQTESAVTPSSDLHQDGTETNPSILEIPTTDEHSKSTLNNLPPHTLNNNKNSSSTLDVPDPKKRKIDENSSSPQPKRIRKTERPFLEAVLTLSQFEGDVIFSLSFVDGTGGREAANQIFQYLKNKLSS